MRRISVKNETSIFAKQGRLSVRNGAVVVLLGCAVVAFTYLIWGFSNPVRGLLWILGLFAVFLLLDFVSLRLSEGELSRREQPTTDQAVPPVADSEFRLVSIPEEEEEWYVRRIIFDRCQASVRISNDPGCLEKVRPHAEALCERPDQLAARLQAFLSAEAKRNPPYGEEIMQLKLDSIDFMFPKEPETGEVFFTEESGGNIFFCSIKNGEFVGFRMES